MVPYQSREIETTSETEQMWASKSQRLYQVSVYIHILQDYDARSGTSARMSDRFAPLERKWLLSLRHFLEGVPRGQYFWRSTGHYAADVSGKCRSYNLFVMN